MSISDREKRNQREAEKTVSPLDVTLAPLGAGDIPRILPLAKALNPEKPEGMLRERLEAMFRSPFICFGILHEKRLVGMIGAWITTRLYCGKQIEIDNFVLAEEVRNGGIGEKALALVHEWAGKEGCLTSELNAYVSNAAAHRFYFREGFKVLGFHFQRDLEEKKAIR